jgi:predicted  nucleic acid-binding Zn-ribbon protein
LNADAKKTGTLTVKEYHPLLRRYELNSMSDNQIAFFVSQKSINSEVEKALRGILAQKSVIAALDAEATAFKEKSAAIGEDQQRLRENMKALKGSAEEKALVERYAREMYEHEDRVQALHRGMAEVRQKREAGQKTLNETMEGLQLDVVLKD